MWGAATFAVGSAIDRGHGRAVMSAGSLLAAVGFAAGRAISQPWMLYAVWAVLGASMAMTLYEPAFNVLTKRYPQHYREGITALTLVGGFASTLAFPALAALIASLGWRGALWSWPRCWGSVSRRCTAWVLRGPAAVAAAHADDPQDDATLREAMHAPAFWLLALSFTLYTFATAALWAHVMPVFASKGMMSCRPPRCWSGSARRRCWGGWSMPGLGRGMSLRALGMAVLLGMPLSLVLLALSSQALPLFLFALLFGLANGLVTIVRGAPGARVLRPQPCRAHRRRDVGRGPAGARRRTVARRLDAALHGRLHAGAAGARRRWASPRWWLSRWRDRRRQR